jgi:hypothetical protein
MKMPRIANPAGILFFRNTTGIRPVLPLEGLFNFHDRGPRTPWALRISRMGYEFYMPYKTLMTLIRPSWLLFQFLQVLSGVTAKKSS